MPVMLAPDLIFLPFSETWQMRIDIPYSLMVRDADQMWSCGQCPLSPAGEVLHPGDLLSQAREVTGFIAGFTEQMDMAAEDVSRLTIYYVEEAPEEAAALAGMFRGAFGAETLLRFVKVPHFYYDGMRIEVDVYATNRKRSFRRYESALLPGLTLEALHMKEGTWANVELPLEAAQLSEGRMERAVSDLLQQAGITASEILSELWTLGTPELSPALGALRNLGLAGPRLSVVNASTYAPVLNGEITTVSGGGRRSVRVTDTGQALVELTFCRMGADFSVTAAVIEGPEDNLGQMRETMLAVDELLFAEGLRFDQVRKSTNLYVAGASAEELHDNMAIRNAYYTKPGPGSTGIPVSGFPDLFARNALSLIGRVR